MSDFTPLLTTKLRPPQARPGLVRRPRLIARLSECLNKPLTLIAAPAGFGKTTLVGEWIAEVPALASNPQSPPFAWFALDPDDNDLARFWRYFIAAIQTQFPRVGEETAGLLQSPSLPSSEALLTPLLNDLTALPRPLALVLDDYHLVEARHIHETLIYLIERRPERFHLILTTRADPPLPLARWRARDQLLELRADELRFTVEEATTFLNVTMGLQLAAKEVAALEARTEGWIAALQLAALSLQGRTDAADFVAAFSGSHRYIVDYLAEEVLQRLPPARQSFLQQTSILERLNGPLCAAVTGQADSQRLLEQLERDNLFLIPLDNEHGWYRYHQLFAEVLRRRQQHDQPAQTAELHRRASNWYAHNGLIEEAVHHAFAGQDVERAVHLIEAHATLLALSGEIHLVRRWLRALPPAVRESRPHLLVIEAWVLAVAGQPPEQIEPLLQTAERLLTEQSPDVARRLHGEILAVRALAQTGYVEDFATIQTAREALANLSTYPPQVRQVIGSTLGTACLVMGDLSTAEHGLRQALAIESSHVLMRCDLLMTLCLVRGAQGRLDDEFSLIGEVQTLMRPMQSAPAGLRLNVHLRHAPCLYERNDLAAAELVTREGLALAQTLGYTVSQSRLHAMLARLALARGDLAAADQSLSTAEQLWRPERFPKGRLVLEALRVTLWLRQGKLAKAKRWAENYAATFDPEPHFIGPSEMTRLALARVWLELGRKDEALTLLRRTQRIAEATGHGRLVIGALTLQALAHQAQGNAREAATAIERALARAEPGGYVRTFVDEGEPARLLISDCRLRIENGALATPALDYVARLLAAFPLPTDIPLIADQPPTAQNLIEPLTDRELEVLRAVASGLSDREVAEQLVVATGTVKRHLNNIYGKLGVHRRTQALARARELGLL